MGQASCGRRAKPNDLAGRPRRDRCSPKAAKTPNGRLDTREQKDGERKAIENMDALVARQCEEQLRRLDEVAIHADPDRVEAQRIWIEYTNQVSAVAQRQGNNQQDSFIASFRDLISARADAEEYGDDTRAIEARLGRLVGVPYPTLPGAAWAAADLMPVSERQAEYDRLEAKYGPRPPVTDDAPKRQAARK